MSKKNTTLARISVEANEHFSILKKRKRIPVSQQVDDLLKKNGVLLDPIPGKTSGLSKARAIKDCEHKNTKYIKLDTMKECLDCGATFYTKYMKQKEYDDAKTQDSTKMSIQPQ